MVAAPLFAWRTRAPRSTISRRQWRGSADEPLAKRESAAA